MVLSLIHEDGKTEFFELRDFPIIVGRDPKCHVCINSENISRKHLEIQKRDDQIYIRDMTLSNWVSYNGEKLEKEEFVEYFYFSKLLLPEGYQLSLSLDAKEEKEAKAKAKKEKVDLYYNPVQTNQSRKSKTKLAKAEKGSGNNILAFGIFLFVVVAGYFYNQNYQQAPISIKPSNQARLIKKEVNYKKIDLDFLNKMQQKLYKCRQPSVREFCETLILNRFGKEGVVEFQKNLFVFKNITRRLNLYKQEIVDIETRINLDSNAMLKIIAYKNTFLAQNLAKIKNKKIKTIFINLYDEKNESLGIIKSYKVDISALGTITDKVRQRAFNDLHIGAGLDVFETYIFPLLKKREDL